MPKRYKEPKGLRHLREALTEADAIRTFTEVKGRVPGSNAELEVFIDCYVREIYNAGFDEWPRRRKPEQTSDTKSN